MHVIKKANGKIAKLWGAVKVQESFYRLLTYTVSTAVENGMLLHNTVTGELIFLDTDEASRLSDLPCSYVTWMDALIQKHFLVRTESDDKKTVDSLRLALKLSETSKEITSYTVLPTTNCNARCFYCYEAGCKHETMTDETADKLVAFMEAHRGNKPLSLNWFGGEPLVGIRQIDRICKALNEKNIPFRSRMTSNGYLFEEESIKRAKEKWNLHKITITLDGTEKVYNETKAYVNPCESPYQRVIHNIRLLLKYGIRVDIRFNIGLHNADDLFGLVDELNQRFEDKHNIRIYALPIHYDCGYHPMDITQEQSEQINARLGALFRKIIKDFPNIYNSELPILKQNCCMMDNDSCVLVLPSGKFGKCSDNIDKHFVGNVEEGITDTTKLKALKERVAFSKCNSCLLYPTCIKLKQCKTGLTCDNKDVGRGVEYTKFAIKRLYEDDIDNNLPVDNGEPL